MSDPSSETEQAATEEGEVATSGPEEAKPNTGATVSNGTPRPEPEPAGTRNRVKVYRLDEDAWEEAGIGDLQCTEVDEDVVFIVKSEDSGAILLSATTQNCDKYARQQDTLIVWTDRDDKDYSLSFQEKEGCVDAWALICKVKGVPESEEEIGPEDDDDGSAVSDSCLDSADSEARLDHDLAIHTRAPELPPPEIGNLARWQEILDQLMTQKQEAMAKGDRDLREMVTNQHEQIAEQLVDKELNYLPKLVDAFNMAEDLEDLESLQRCYSIMTGMFTMCNNALFEALFADDIILEAAGMMEYDPAHKEVKKHREYLTETARFKEVVAFGDESLVKQIHQAYRIQYIKDVIFAGVLDDYLQSTLQSYIYYSQVEVLEKLSSDKRYMDELFQGFNDAALSPEAYRDRIMLLKELCVLAKQLPGEQKPMLYNALVDQGLFELFSDWMSHPLLDVKRAALGILAIFQQQDTQLIRNSILRPRSPGNGKPNLLKVCALAFVAERSTVLLPQIMAAIKCIVDVENFDSTNPTDKNKLLQMFYADCMDTLLEPLGWDTSSEHDMVRHEQVNHAICLLAHVIPIHTYHVKNYVMRKGVLKTAMTHLTSGKRVLVLAALRLLRVVVGLKNEFYFRHLVKLSLFTPMVELLVENGPKYNLLNSCILEMLKFIEQDNIKTLVEHFAEVHGDSLRKLTYVTTAQDLLNKHARNNESYTEDQYKSDSAAENQDKGNRRKRDTTMDMEEEDYWDDEGDSKAAIAATAAAAESTEVEEDRTVGAEETSPDAAAQGGSDTPFQPFRKRLVNYDSDEDDEDDAIFALAKKQPRTEPIVVD